MKWVLTFFLFTAITACSSEPQRKIAEINLPNSQVLYGIYPSAFAQGQNLNAFEAIRRRIPEIKSLGADVIWLLPVFQAGTPGMSYDITDYYKINPELGTETQLKRLVSEAHKAGLKVILDIALNHTSIQHPFAQDVIAQGDKSRHYTFYQHDLPPGPYSNFYNKLQKGSGDFIFYFWDDLVNLNYENSEVQTYAINVLEYWIKHTDVDGYRLDAAWGPASRWPDFFKTVNAKLKRLKSDVFLIAEDKASYPVNFQGSNYPSLYQSGFSAAYDWNNEDPAWVSKWSFQTGSTMAETVFDLDPTSAAKAFSQGLNYTENAVVQPLRYLEDNDTPSFVSPRTVAQTKFAAEAIFLLPGDPVIFHGQETAQAHGQWDFPSYDPAKTMRSYNPDMWDFYRNLIHLRKSSAALREGSLQLKASENPSAVDFIRGETDTIEIQFDHSKVLRNGVPISFDEIVK